MSVWPQMAPGDLPETALRLLGVYAPTKIDPMTSIMPAYADGGVIVGVQKPLKDFAINAD